ncbi:MAG: hypothetical protein ACTSWY_05430 [Promethearchaeota archaeon]
MKFDKRFKAITAVLIITGALLTTNALIDYITLIDDEWTFPENVYETKFEACTRWAGDWLVQSIESSGKFKYLYYIETDTYSDDYSYLRHWGTAYSLIYLYNQTGDIKYRDAAVKTFDWGLQYYYEFTYNSSIGFLYYGGQSNTGGAALALMALTTYKSSVNNTDSENYEKYDEYIYKLANFLLWAQQPEGWIRSYHIRYGDYNDWTNTTFYPSESMLALSLLYKLTRNETYADALSKAYNFYSELSLFNWKQSAFMPWTSSAFSELFYLTHNQSYAQYVFDLCDWKIGYQWQTDQFDECGVNKKGGFHTNPTVGTSSSLEGIGDAFHVAQILNDTEHLESYNKSLVLGMEYLLSLQVRREECEIWNLSCPQRVFGGFRGCYCTCDYNMSLRNDYTQHSLSAMIKMWKYMPKESILSINFR